MCSWVKLGVGAQSVSFLYLVLRYHSHDLDSVHFVAVCLRLERIKAVKQLCRVTIHRQYCTKTCTEKIWQFRIFSIEQYNSMTGYKTHTTLCASCLGPHLKLRCSVLSMLHQQAQILALSSSG